MNNKALFALLCCMYLTPKVHAWDMEFFSDMEDSLHNMSKRMERRVSSFFDNDLDATLDALQARIDKMREHFDTMQEQLVQQYESLTNTTEDKSTSAPLLTVKDEDSVIRITVSVGDVETDIIENHLENNTLVIAIPKNKPTLKVIVQPTSVIVTGNKVVEKEQTGDDKKASSHVVSSRRIHYEQTLPSTVITTENVNITHSADEKTLTIELPKKTHKQQFSIKKQ